MCQEQIEFYKQQEKIFYQHIDEYTKRLLDNKICVVDDSEFVLPHFNASLTDSLEEEEDFINMGLSYSFIDVQTESSDLRIYHVYETHYNHDSRCYLNEVITYSAVSLADFINKIVNINPLPNHKCVYRGHGNWIYDLVPGIYRAGNEDILKNESRYIKDIVASNPRFFEGCRTALDILAVLQHFGFPTRLLDFTENPLVALYMACASDPSSHADVMRIDINEESFKYYDSDTVSLLSNIALFDDDIDVRNFNYEHYHSLFDLYKGYSYNRYGNCIDDGQRLEMIRKFNMRPDIKRLAHRIREEKPYFRNEIDPMHLENTVLLVKPKQEFTRLSLQSGLFALFGINQHKQELVDFEFQNLEFRITHIIIPSDCKKKILDELEKINIHQGTLFGDMDHILRQRLKR